MSRSDGKRRFILASLGLALGWAPAALLRADILDEGDASGTATATAVTGTATSTATGVGSVGKPPLDPKNSKTGTGTTTTGTAGATGPRPVGTAPEKGDSSTQLAPKFPGKARPTGRDKQPVHFESDGLKGLREKGWIELEKNVVVTQGDLRVEADKAEVYYDEGTKDVQRVVASGNVRISNIDENTGEKLKAYGDQMVFNNRERSVVVEGNARLWRGEDSVVRGKRITYELDTGWIRADRVAGELTAPQQPRKPK